MSSSIGIIGAFVPDMHDFEETLLELTKYGQPVVFNHGSENWRVKINVFVTGKGVGFEVASDHGCRTPRVAVNQCYSRLVKALNQIKGKA